MNLNKLFELFDIEEERRYDDELNGPEPLGASIKENIYKKAYENFIRYYKTYFGGTTSTGENLDVIVKNNLSLEEASVIYMYTSHGVHSDVNMQLRHNPNRLDRDIREYCELLNRALDKMPCFDNGVVYRDILDKPLQLVPPIPELIVPPIPLQIVPLKPNHFVPFYKKNSGTRVFQSFKLDQLVTSQFI